MSVPDKGIPETRRAHSILYICFYYFEVHVSAQANKGNNKITELRTILQRESPNS